MLFGNLTYEELKHAAKQDWIILVPTGCIEQQGPHLPVDFDTWFVAQVCIASSDLAKEEYGVSSLVLPALPFGPTQEHRGFGSGYIDLPQSLHEEVMTEVLRSLHDQGFRRIIIWRGCGQHDLSEVVASLNDDILEGAMIWQPDLPYADVWERIDAPKVPSGHADAFATSIAMYLRPDSVRTSLIRNPKNIEPDWDNPYLDFSKYSDTGVIGDPTAASKELGAKLWTEVTKEVASMINHFDMHGARG